MSWTALQGICRAWSFRKCCAGNAGASRACRKNANFSGLIDRNDVLKIAVQTVLQPNSVDWGMPNDNIEGQGLPREALGAKRIGKGNILVSKASADRTSVLCGLCRVRELASIQRHVLTVKVV